MDNALASLGLAQHYTTNQIIGNLLLSIFIGIAIAWIYKRTHQGVSYSQSFVVSLVLMTITTAAAIMVIGNNLTRAFGLIGAFSVVRFRTAIKDTRDISFVFFSLVEGLAAGTGSYQIAFLSLFMFTAVVYFLSRSQFGKYSPYEFLLSFHLPVKSKAENTYLKLFDKYISEYLLVSFRSASKSTDIESAYSIKLKNPNDYDALIKELKKLGLTHIEMLSSQSDIDY